MIVRISSVIILDEVLNRHLDQDIPYGGGRYAFITMATLYCPLCRRVELVSHVKRDHWVICSSIVNDGITIFMVQREILESRKSSITCVVIYVIVYNPVDDCTV